MTYSYTISFDKYKDFLNRYGWCTTRSHGIDWTKQLRSDLYPANLSDVVAQLKTLDKEEGYEFLSPFLDAVYKKIKRT